MKRFAGVITLLFALALAGHAQVAPVQNVVRGIDIQGIEHLSPDAQQQLHAAIKLQEGQPFSQDVANEDVARIRELGWFIRASVRTEPVEGGIRAIYTLVENPVVTSIDFIGNTVLTDADLLHMISTKSGQVLNRNLISPDAQAIKEQYATRGFTLVEVTDINITPEGKLEFIIFEPRIGEVRIEGSNETIRLKTRDYVIRRELVIHPGDVYNTKAITQSLNNLEQTGLFQEVTAVPDPGTEPGTLTLTVRVKERDNYGTLALGAGHSNIQGLIGFIDVSNNNLFGTGQRLSTRVQVGADPSYEVSYTNPWAIGHTRRASTSLTIDAYNKTILREAIQNNTTTTYHEQRRGADITLGREIARYTRTYVTFRADHISASPSDNQAVLPIGLQQGANVRSIAVSTIFDLRRNATGALDVLNPVKGTYASAALEVAGLGGAHFMKFSGDWRKYVPIVFSAHHRTADSAEPAKKRSPWVYASRLTAGTISGAPPYLDQFLIGGADTLRGFKEDRFPGENMVLWNNELRFPVADALQLVSFVDTGDAWNGDFARQVGDLRFKLHTGYGFGIRVITPIGPLRLDYGWSLGGGNEFHFGVGSTF